MLGFNGGYGAQVYAGAGYMVLQPNYRGSTNYGEKLKTEIVGRLLPKGYEDIMTGVDYLIAQGMVDSTKMGALGWSAGGHWSNWISATHDALQGDQLGRRRRELDLDVSQSDMQRIRQWYLGDKMYGTTSIEYQNWWKQSPIEYIKNAKTPMMIHVVDGDPRVPRPQTEEMHMALSKLGVPNEFWVYPGQHPRHPRSAQPVPEVGGRDGVDGLLRARQRQEVRVARRAEVGCEGRTADGGRGDAAAVTAGSTVEGRRSRNYEQRVDRSKLVSRPDLTLASS